MLQNVKLNLNKAIRTHKKNPHQIYYLVIYQTQRVCEPAERMSTLVPRSLQKLVVVLLPVKTNNFFVFFIQQHKSNYGQEVNVDAQYVL